ncbi:MAG: hypothetical protein EB038_10610 [Cyclobacteriaceae bacterium]|nr:hypothetical protein [Cyclobacteriaceae bacterium]
MTATGLQKYIDINLDATKKFKVDINIYSPDPSQGVIVTSELLDPSVEQITSIARLTLQDVHADSIMTFKFPNTDDVLECFQDGGEIICRKAQAYRL